MKKLLLPLLITSLLLGLLIYWLWSRNQSTMKPFSQAPTPISAQPTPAPENDDLSMDDDEESIPEKFDDHTDKQKEFTQKLSEMNEEIKRCQQAVNAQFPIEKMESKAPAFKNIETLKRSLDIFYEAVSKKMNKANEFVQFLDSVPEGEIDPKRLFRQLGDVEDCGDFEEESIVDMAITAAQEKHWSAGDRKELVLTLLKHFRDQLNTSLGLHQIISKVEILQNLADEGFISERVTQDINNFQQLVDNTETEFRNNVPSDMMDRKYPTTRQISELKSLENDLNEKVREPMRELFTTVENSY